MQALEVIRGVAPADYGDQSSLVVHIVTKSGLDQSKPIGSASFGYGSFKSPSGDGSIGIGSHTVGDFLSVSGVRTDRFLDPPEFEALHDTGDNVSLFNRLDFHPNDADTLHLNLQAARSGVDVPNTYDTVAQDQHQKSRRSTSPGLLACDRIKTLLTANGFVRRIIDVCAERRSVHDTPATISQDQGMTNMGAKADVTVNTTIEVRWNGCSPKRRNTSPSALPIRRLGLRNESGEPTRAGAVRGPASGHLSSTTSRSRSSSRRHTQDDIKAGPRLQSGRQTDHYEVEHRDARSAAAWRLVCAAERNR